MPKYKSIIIIAGNHDGIIEKRPVLENDPFWAKDWGEKRFDLYFAKQKEGNIHYLCDSGIEFEFEELDYHIDGRSAIVDGPLFFKKRKFKIWGSPWTKRFEGMNPNCMAFTVDTEEELAEKWKLIPDDVDILVTHCPPCGILDEVDGLIEGYICDENVGSESLCDRIWDLNLRLHIFGHIHEGYGVDENQYNYLRNGEELSFPIYVNASHVNEYYEPVNKPIRLNLEI